MTLLRIQRFIAVFSIVATFGSPSYGIDRVDSLIDGIVSRASEIHCAKYQYSYVAKVTQNGTVTFHRQTHLSLTRDGFDWLVRETGSQNFRMKRNDVSLTYYETIAQEDSSETQTSLHVEAPETLQDLIHQNACYAVGCLGSFWFPSQSSFVDTHRDTAVITGDRTIDGVATVTIEWPVTATDFDEAMVVIPNEIGRAKRGRLRIHTAPSLGYALPLIEYVAPDDSVAQSFACHDFQECSGGIFLPQRADCVTRLDRGEQRSAFTLEKISHVNEPLPEDEFSLNIPKGTRVRDSRPGVPTSIFYLESQDQFNNLNRVLAPAEADHTPSMRVTLLTLNFLVLITLVICYMVYQCTHNSTSAS